MITMSGTRPIDEQPHVPPRAAATTKPETADFHREAATTKKWLTQSCDESRSSVSVSTPVTQECSSVVSAGSSSDTIGDDGKSSTISCSDSVRSPSIPVIPVVPLNKTQMKQVVRRWWGTKQMQLTGLVPVELPSAPPPYVDDRNATKQPGSSKCSDTELDSANTGNNTQDGNLTNMADNAYTDISSIRVAMQSMFSDMQPPVGFNDDTNPSPNVRRGNGGVRRPNNTADLNHTIQTTLQSLAAEPTDKHIRNRIKTMSVSNSRLLSQHMVRNPTLMQHFCTADRGSIVASLIERHGDADGMVSYVMSNFVSLVREKGGCIAVLRILQHVSPADRAAAFAQLRALPDVATHQYSNFVLQYFIEGGQNENGLGTEGIPVQPTAADVCHELINRELSNAQTLRTWSSSKCGSRVVDHVIRNARKADAHVFFAKIFSDTNLVLYLGAHEFGHFNLKTAFELMVENAQEEPELLRKYYGIAEPLLRDGRYSRWVFRRAKTSLVLLRAFSQLMES